MTFPWQQWNVHSNDIRQGNYCESVSLKLALLQIKKVIVQPTSKGAIELSRQ